MTEEEAKQLITKYTTGNGTESEKALVEQWIMQFNDGDIDVSPKRIEELRKHIYNKLPGSNSDLKKFSLWPIIATVAAAVSIIGISTWMFKPWEDKTINIKQVQDIQPGGNRATITYANGQTIQLDDRKNGIIVNEKKLTYTDGSMIVASNLTGTQTISTPKGGEYQIVLSDGTKVWLNAASTLTFATSLRERGEEKRRVRLSGEAYFEVSKDKKLPFVVTTGQQDVLVLGTHFNINAYEPEIAIKTTLLEGSVKVSRPKTNGIPRKIILSPGEQSICSKDAILVKKVDVGLELAWKNGNTEFENADLKTIMAMVERWYNIEVHYQGKPITTRFTGSISRSRNISEILNFLESTGAVHFKIEGRRVIAMN